MNRRYILIPILIAVVRLLLPETASAQWNTLLVADTMDYRGVVTVDRNWAWFTGYSGENSTVQVTADGGQTWAGGILHGYQINDLAESNFANVLLVGRSEECDCAVVVRSTDGGSNWGISTVESNPGLNTVIYVTPSTAFIAGANGLILGSIDAGATWRVAMDEGDDVIMNMVFPSVRTGYAIAGADGNEETATLLYGTTDGGESWRVIFDGAEAEMSFDGVSFADPGKGLLAGFSDGPTLWITTDAGKSWTDVFHIDDPSLRFRTVTFAGGDTAFAAGDNGLIYASYDGGYTWQQDRTLFDAPVHDISFRDGVGWAVGDDGTRFKTVRPVAPEEYCLPPVTGPTYGSGLTFVGLDASPAIRRASRGDELYTWHRGGTAVPSIRRGQQYTVEIATDPNNIDGRNSSRVWIDFNRDGDFEDDREDVGIWDRHELATIQKVVFTVPIDAVEGETIMRVYTDMPDDFGHDEPSPCGYITSENVIGHHGEVEDYTLRIVNENAASVEQVDAEPVRASVAYGHLRVHGLEGRSSLELLDIEGRKVRQWESVSGASALEVGDLPTGTYFVRIDRTGDLIRVEIAQ